MYLIKQNTDLWFIGVYSNNFADRQEEIITEDAHLSFAKWAFQKGIKPPIILYHQPRYDPVVHLANFIGLNKGIFTSDQYNANILTMYKSTAFAQAEYIVPLKGFMFVLGRVFPSKVPLVEKLLLNNSSEYGMSHGFLGIKSDGLITTYFSHEFSVLKADDAANGVTAIGFGDIVMANTKTLTPEEAEIIQDELTPEAVEDGLQKARDILTQILGSKSQDDINAALENLIKEEVTEEVEEPEETSVETEQMQKAFYQDIYETFQLVKKELDALKAQIKALEKDEDEKIASMFFGTPNFKSVMAEPTEEDNELLEQLKENLQTPSEDNIFSLAFPSGLFGGKS